MPSQMNGRVIWEGDPFFEKKKRTERLSGRTVVTLLLRQQRERGKLLTLHLALDLCVCPSKCLANLCKPAQNVHRIAPHRVIHGLLF